MLGGSCIQKDHCKRDLPVRIPLLMERSNMELLPGHEVLVTKVGESKNNKETIILFENHQN